MDLIEIKTMNGFELFLFPRLPMVKCSLFLTLRGLLVNRKDLQALTLVRPTQKNLVLDPLAVLHLDNRLYNLDVLLLFFVWLRKWS